MCIYKILEAFIYLKVCTYRINSVSHIFKPPGQPTFLLLYVWISCFCCTISVIDLIKLLENWNSFSVFHSCCIFSKEYRLIFPHFHILHMIAVQRLRSDSLYTLSFQGTIYLMCCVYSALYDFKCLKIFVIYFLLPIFLNLDSLRFGSQYVLYPFIHC